MNKETSVASSSGSATTFIESSGSSVFRCETESSTCGRLCVYDLQPIDIGQNVLQLTSRWGMLVSPDLDVEDVGQEFISVRTKGDGGCALHAVWGTPTLEHGLALAGGQLHGRNQCCDMLADSWDAAKTHVGN